MLAAWPQTNLTELVDELQELVPLASIQSLQDNQLRQTVGPFHHLRTAELGNKFDTDSDCTTCPEVGPDTDSAGIDCRLRTPLPGPRTRLGSDIVAGSLAGSIRYLTADCNS
jgi:hypothetical protein